MMMTRVKVKLHLKGSKSSSKSETKGRDRLLKLPETMMKLKTQRRTLRIRVKRTKNHPKKSQVRTKKARTHPHNLAGNNFRICFLVVQVVQEMNMAGSWQV
jgi:hypothetical protein